ncbi:hypothetical protein [Longitalea luteola]|uniref:hypothetical protein n=1 Tax=Longitalea luteola TaxID=2812563 RepID=UPI001A95838A|nr:hypothetical protein [Longitalea luteola]
MPPSADYSHIDDHEKAQQLCAQKELVKLHLMPLDWGGQDLVMNIIYVPPFVLEEKARIDGMIEELLVAGHNLNYSAVPEYKGNSFVASKLVITISGDKEIELTIDIW